MSANDKLAATFHPAPPGHPELPHLQLPEVDLANAHGWVAHETIAAELVACTLGHRRHAERLELRTDMSGRLAHASRIIRRALATLHPAPPLHRP